MCEHVCGRMRVCMHLVVGSLPTLQAIHCDRMMRVLYCESVFTSHTVGLFVFCKLTKSSWA